VTGLDELAGTSNYFIGNNPVKWQTNVPTYAKVKYERIYSGIDLVYYGNQQQLEYMTLSLRRVRTHVAYSLTFTERSGFAGTRGANWCSRSASVKYAGMLRLCIRRRMERGSWLRDTMSSRTRTGLDSNWRSMMPAGRYTSIPL